MVKAVSYKRLNDLSTKSDINLICVYYFLDFRRRANLLKMHTRIKISSQETTLPVKCVSNDKKIVHL